VNKAQLIALVLSDEHSLLDGGCCRRDRQFMKRFLLLSLILIQGALATENANPSVEPLPITIQGREEHPIVYLTKQDLQQARERRDKYAWAKKASDALTAAADVWVAKSDDEIRKMIPPPGACYAYGKAGCPICDGKFPGEWGAKGTATLEDPGHVKCVNGHRLPDQDHPDTGEGWTDASGKKFYFVGAYNAFVVETLQNALNRLTLAYGLTEDRKYADKAALILDELARIYPTSETGARDYPSVPPSGRFNRPWYQVARVLVMYVNHYDLLMMGDALSTPSSVPGMTKRENIEKNLLLNAALYCYKQAADTPMLNNGVADYQRGQMAVAAAMGIPEYMKYAVDGPFGLRNMIENNIDADGQYYETSYLYGSHGRSLYMNMAEILQHYRDAEHPNGYDIATLPKFRASFLLPRARLDGAGLNIMLGDDGPNVKMAEPEAKTLAFELNEMEHLAALTRDPKDIQLLADRAGDLDAARATSPQGEWLLFHGVDAVRHDGKAVVHPLTGNDINASDLLAGRGLAILRDGNTPNKRAATVRFGPTLNHGNYDEMNLGVYAHGYDLTYDLGYLWGAAHVYRGWTRQTASHNLVLVDETPQLKDGWTSGSVDVFVARPGFTLTRGSNLNCYASQKLSKYERTVMMVKATDEESYLLDIFRVKGGTKHDYIFHARGTQLTTDGLDLGAPASGSLAGEDVRWGEMLGSDGDVKGVTELYWSPPPESGFGFLMHPRRAKTSGPWSGTWEIADDAHLRINMLPTDDAEVVTAEAPGVDLTYPKSAYVLVRRNGENLSSTFAAVIEPYGRERVVSKVTALKGDGADAVGVKVELVSGRTDYLLQSDTPASWTDGELVLSIDSGSARLVSQNGKFIDATLVGGTLLSAGDFKVTAKQAVFSGKIVRVDYHECALYVDGELPTGDALAGEFLSIGRDTYSHRSSYRIAGVSTRSHMTRIQLAPTTLLLARGHLGEKSRGNVLDNIVPQEYAKSVKRTPSGYFRGKKIASADGSAKTTIREITDPDTRLIEVMDASAFKAGSDILIFDVQDGDDFVIPSVIHEAR
jgi:hypothetical protein